MMDRALKIKWREEKMVKESSSSLVISSSKKKPLAQTEQP